MVYNVTSSNRVSFDDLVTQTFEVSGVWDPDEIHRRFGPSIGTPTYTPFRLSVSWKILPIHCQNLKRFFNPIWSFRPKGTWTVSWYKSVPGKGDFLLFLDTFVWLSIIRVWVTPGVLQFTSFFRMKLLNVYIELNITWFYIDHRGWRLKCL